MAVFQLLPSLADDEYAALKNDIRVSGVLVPVEYDDLGNILDGHHRVRAWTELRAEGVAVPEYPRLTRFGLSDEQKRTHARKLNLMRRHLNQAQKREIIKAQLRETPHLSNRQIAAVLGVSDPTVGAVRRELEDSGEVLKFSTSIGADGKEYPRQRPAPSEPLPFDAATDLDDEPLDAYEELIAAQYMPAIFASNEREQQQAQALAQSATSEDAQTGSVTDARRRQMAQRRDEQAARAAAVDFTGLGKYRVIYADPPWQYGNTMPEYFTEQAHHYPTMTIAQIAAMPVQSIVEDNAVLFLWVTSPILYDAAPIIEAWGFTYKAMFVWDKIKHNMGHYNSVRHEMLLICTRGSCQPDVRKLFDSVQAVERSDRHSEKPAVFREMIDTLYPNGKRIEIFARVRHEGWDVYGNDAPAEQAA